MRTVQRMPTLTSWLLRLGNAGAARNAATACAERRAAEARVDALVRRFETTRRRGITTAADFDRFVQQGTRGLVEQRQVV